MAAGGRPRWSRTRIVPSPSGRSSKRATLSGSPGYVQSSSSTRPGSSARIRPSVRWSPSSSFQTSRKRPPTRNSSSTTFASQRPSRSGSVNADQTSSGAKSYRLSNRTPARSPSDLSFPSITPSSPQFGLQGVQPVRPEPPDPVVELHEALVLERIQAARAVRPGADHAVLPQNAEVLRHARPRNRERGRDLTGRAFAFGDELDDASSRRIRESLE